MNSRKATAATALPPSRPSSRSRSRPKHQLSTPGYFFGTLFYSMLVFLFWSHPWTLAPLFVLLLFIFLPVRAAKYLRLKWVFFLADYCYWANLFCCAVLLFFPTDDRLVSTAFALSDGPLSGALIVWRCPYVFGSLEATTSVMIHVLPGLGIYAHRYFPCSQVGWKGYLALAREALANPAAFWGAAAPAAARPAVQRRAPPPGDVFWLVVAPLAFYVTWQLVYWFLVQVGGFIGAWGFWSALPPGSVLMRMLCTHISIMTVNGF